MTPLEKAARAVRLTQTGGGGTPDRWMIPLDEQSLDAACERIARAVLEAIRWPSNGQIAAMDLADTAHGHWITGIDHILGKGK